MSFRSRSRTVQPIVQRRSLSGSRLPSNLSSYTSNRPLSSAYPSSTSYGTSNYISPYTSSLSRDYNSIPSSRNSYYNSTTNTPRRDSYNGSSTVYKNLYTSDRYISPYASYDNGVTTAGLSLKSSSYGSNGYTNKTSYTPLLSNKSLNRHSAKLLSASSTSLNAYSSPVSTAKTESSTLLGRSQSFRDQATERKSRTLRRNQSLKSERSLSASSEKSEGYEVRQPFFCHRLIALVVFSRNDARILFYRVAARKHQQDHDLARAAPSHPNRVRLQIIRKMAETSLIIRHCMKQLGKYRHPFLSLESIVLETNSDRIASSQKW